MTMRVSLSFCFLNFITVYLPSTVDTNPPSSTKSMTTALAITTPEMALIKGNIVKSLKKLVYA